TARIPAGRPLAVFRQTNTGADDRDRTGDLVLTKDVLCQLSYIGPRTTPVMERETGIEPATNSLEGCDSTTELLPQARNSTRKNWWRDKDSNLGRHWAGRFT